MNWLFYTICTMILYGFVNFMYKVAASNNCPSHIILNKSALIVSILSLFGFILTANKFDNYFWIIVFALINSTFFALGIIAKMISLKKTSSSIIFPITKLNSVFLIVFAIFIFKESPLLNQWLGIALSFFMLFFISFNLTEEKDNKNTYSKEGQKWGIFYAILAALSTSVSMLTGKLASTRVPLLSYMLLSYSLVYLNTLWINKFFIKTKFKTKEEKKQNYKIWDNYWSSKFFWLLYEPKGSFAGAFVFDSRDYFQCFYHTNIFIHYFLQRKIDFQENNCFIGKFSFNLSDQFVKYKDILTFIVK
eukprot:TRINITY_DN28847_c0_g1_i1.p1 TRINITY_DN28847_c0_g1~~TRINITY_DN28847_c0_g1_i1.p1  ORF type:complete len:305 (-),score=24.82 TRINITY_DN28847_c0_g1_i1:403-1317(-)